ncbi:MAG: 3-dehydroquinate synthase II [Candidatus Thermoplasmatota archaeon]
MKPLWMDLRGVSVQKRIGYLRAAREADVEAALVAEDTTQGFDLPLVLASPDGQLVRDGKRIGAIHTVGDAASASHAGAAEGIAAITFPDWRVIPLESLIVARRDRPGTLFAFAATPEQAGLFAATLGTGVHGVILAPSKPGDILEARRRMESVAQPPATAPSESGHLERCDITELSEGGMAERVCLDATERFAPQEGLAVGATAASLALVHAETLENPHIAARPFRVNAGAIHHYVLAEAGRTLYLSELSSGTRLAALDAGGNSRTVTVGRAKIERRPHTLVRWRGPSGPGHAFLQTAETVCLVAPDGAARPVTALKPGDTILTWAQPGSRHTGAPIDEPVVER